MKRNIHVKWFFPHQVEEVWECLTNAELISIWLMQNDFKAEAGHHFKFYSKPLPKMGWDGVIYCEVLEVILNKRLVYSWKGGPKPGVINLDTLLTWTLTPTREGTEVVLEHTGFSGFKNIISSMFMENGWKKGIARRLDQLLNKLYNEQA